MSDVTVRRSSLDGVISALTHGVRVHTTIMPRVEPVIATPRVPFLKRVQQFLCGLHGHDSTLAWGNNRWYTVCSSCGYESAGWDVTPKKITKSR